MTRIGIVGVGAVGARLARQLVSTDVDEVVLRDESLNRAEQVAAASGEGASVDRGGLTEPPRRRRGRPGRPGRAQSEQAAVFMRRGPARGVHQSDDIDDVAGVAGPRPRGA